MSFPSKLICFLVFLTLILQSCTPDLTELWLEENGGGKMAITYDLGEMAGMAQGLMQELGEDKEDKGIWEKKEIIDSTMNFYDIMPDSVKNTLSNPAALKNMNMDFKVNSLKEEAKMSIRIKYKDQAELEEILRVMKEAQKDSTNPMMGGGDDGEVEQLMMDYSLDLKNGIIRLPGMDINEFLEDPEFAEIMGGLDSLDTSDPNEMMMFEMMFGKNSKTIVHAPGKILFTDDMNAKVKGNTVIFEDNLLEMLKAQKSNDRLIKFKK